MVVVIVQGKMELRCDLLQMRDEGGAAVRAVARAAASGAIASGRRAPFPAPNLCFVIQNAAPVSSPAPPSVFLAGSSPPPAGAGQPFD